MRTLAYIFLTVLFFHSDIQAQTAISIAEARTIDAEGSLTRSGELVELTGIAIGPNFRSGGHTWVLFDTVDNVGITVFDFGNDVGYNVTDGDALRITGELDEFNGLAELVPESIEVLSSGNELPEPETVTELNENSEAKLIRIENVRLVNPSQWGSSDFNVDLTDGTNTFQMRIDGDTDIAGMAAPQDSFDVIGVGGQFDSSSPYLEGYQIFPRSASDIDPYNTGGNTGIEYTEITIEQAREVDADGIASRLDENVAVRGITHGINFRPFGLQFTIINQDNKGVDIFSSSNTFDYEFKEGDELLIKGKIDQFRGLTQINPDSLFVLSSDNALVEPKAVTELDESVEGSLVRVPMSGFVDPQEWLGDGTDFNVDIMVAGNVLTLRIDADSELSTMAIPDPESFVTGIVSQFDFSAPFDDGYQLYPRFISDFAPVLSVETIPSSEISVYPNPSSGQLNISTKYTLSKLELFDLQGRKLVEDRYPASSILLNGVGKGVYLLKITSSDNRQYTQLLWVK